MNKFNTTEETARNDLDFRVETLEQLRLGQQSKLDYITITQAVNLDSLELQQASNTTNIGNKVSKTDHTVNKIFISSASGVVETSSVASSELSKLPNISVSQPVNLDDIETNSNASKTKTDLITITGGVNLDDIQTNSNASKAKTDLITIIGTVNLDDIETNSNASKAKTDLITINQNVNLDDIETNSNASKAKTDLITINQNVNLDDIETNSNASKVITDFISISQSINLDTIGDDVPTNKFKLTGVSYNDFISAGTLTLEAGDHGGISAGTDNGDINIIGGYDTANDAGNIVIKQNNTDRIKLTDTDTTIGILTNNYLRVDTNVLVNNNPGMKYESNAFFLLKKRTVINHWDLVMDQGNNFWSGFYNARSWDCYESATKYDKDTNGATLFLNYYSHGNVSICENGGKCSIGVTDGSSKCLLHVGADNTYQTNDTGISSLHDMDSVSYLTEATTQVQNASFFDFADVVAGYDLSIYAEGMIYTSTYVGASDRRIKKNITEIDDERSLVQLRNLPCVSYEYLDNFKNGEYKTVGFIAQDVAEIMPNCIKKVSDIIPNEMRKLENVAWEEVKDNEGTIKYKLLNQSLEECNYRFYVKKDASSKEVRVELAYPFLFNKKYEQVYCYGKRIDDFLAIDKNKIFAIGFSATQEIDRQQQLDKAKIASMETEITNLKTQISDILSRLDASGI